MSASRFARPPLALGGIFPAGGGAAAAGAGLGAAAGTAGGGAGIPPPPPLPPPPLESYLSKIDGSTPYGQRQVSELLWGLREVHTELRQRTSAIIFCSTAPRGKCIANILKYFWYSSGMAAAAGT